MTSAHGVKLDISIIEGKSTLPAFIFIHGLGMNKNFWSNPSKARIFGGLFPLSRIVKIPEKIPPSKFCTLFHDLSQKGCTVISWSQRRPVGPADFAISELSEVIQKVNKMPHNGIVLVCHSRGGLIARSLLTNPNSGSTSDIIALITLCSPHKGSKMAELSQHLSPFALFLKSILPVSKQTAITKTISRSLDFLSSSAVKELLPDSEFLKTLSVIKPTNLYCLSIGGTDPTLFSLAGKIPIPQSIAKVLPQKTVPDEIRPGKGDGLVSIKSSVLPYGDEHMDFPLNHASIVISKTTRDFIIDKLTTRGII